ncbi:MAG: hypothetical protein IT159_15515 [Bryobacterales bacterium]|nr:hypothetical protein [Bryobacterales bacterium]
MNYESLITLDSTTRPGVVFTIRRMSLGRRIELTTRLRELLSKIEFLEAGQRPAESLEAAIVGTEIEKAYLAWGLAGISGLEVDGQAATPETLAAAGPEDLAREIVEAIKAEAGLTQAERKN